MLQLRGVPLRVTLRAGLAVYEVLSELARMGMKPCEQAAEFAIQPLPQPLLAIST